MSNEVELLNERVFLMELASDSSIDGIMIFDTKLNCIYWNKTSELLTGITRAEAIGKHIFDLFPDFSTNKDIQSAISHAVKGRKSFVPYEKAPQMGRYCEHHFVPLSSGAGEVTAIQIIVHDVAHRVKIEKELKALNKSLVKKNKELKLMNSELVTFAHITSHELKEPIHKIYSFAELLQDKEVAILSETGKNYFKRIQASAQRMRLLTDDILAYSEINAQKKDIATLDINVKTLQVIKELQAEITQKEATVTVDGSGTFKGYRSLVITLLRHLISNALRFQKEGVKPRVTVISREVTSNDIVHPDVLPDTKYLRISVVDNGIGFDQDKADDIFRMFYRAHPNSYPGTGIGLTVCKKIAELHGGFITADSREDEGSTFNVFLPADLK